MAIAKSWSAKRIAESWRFRGGTAGACSQLRHDCDDTNNGENAIPRITPIGVKCGELASLFPRVPAVVLEGDDRISRFVDSTLDWLGLMDRNPDEGQPSFDCSLFDLARNHHSGNVRVGDVVRFMPGVLGHIGRKFLVCPGASGGPPRARPNLFYSGGRRIPVPQDIVDLAWSLMSEVLLSALPKQAKRLSYAVEVDVLVYATSSSDVSRVHALLADSTGVWSELGQRIDAAKDDAAGIFQRKGLRDLFALGSVIPGFGGMLSALNERMTVPDERLTPKDFRVIGSAHVDDTRYITALMGRRQNLDTEIRWQGRWVSLPVTASAMALFPSARIASLSDIPATRHRVLVQDVPNAEAAPSRNITVSLAIVDPLPSVLPAD